MRTERVAWAMTVAPRRACVTTVQVPRREGAVQVNWPDERVRRHRPGMPTPALPRNASDCTTRVVPRGALPRVRTPAAVTVTAVRRRGGAVRTTTPPGRPVPGASGVAAPLPPPVAGEPPGYPDPPPGADPPPSPGVPVAQGFVRRGGGSPGRANVAPIHRQRAGAAMACCDDTEHTEISVAAQ